MTQIVTLAQTQLQLAMSNPQMHNLYMAYRKMYEAIGVKNIDQILPPPPPPQAATRPVAMTKAVAFTTPLNFGDR